MSTRTNSVERAMAAITDMQAIVRLAEFGVTDPEKVLVAAGVDPNDWRSMPNPEKAMNVVDAVDPAMFLDQLRLTIGAHEQEDLSHVFNCGGLAPGSREFEPRGATLADHLRTVGERYPERGAFIEPALDMLREVGLEPSEKRWRNFAEGQQAGRRSGTGLPGSDL